MKPVIPLLLAVILVPVMASAQTTTIVDDNWADGGRNNGADLLDTDWWTSTSSQAIEVSAGSLGLVTGSASGRGIHGTFASQTLGIGETLRATFTFNTPTTIGSAKQSAFRIGLFDTTGKPGLAADLSASSGTPNHIYDGLPGYMMDFDVNFASANIQFRQHDVAQTTGQLMANTSPDYITPSGWSGGSIYSFAANTSYTGIWSLTRTGTDALDLSGSLYQGNTLLSTFTKSQLSGIVSAFGMLAFHVTSGTFGSSGTPSTADNGIDFSNVKIEYLSVPEPSSLTLLFAGALIFGRSVWRRR